MITVVIKPQHLKGNMWSHQLNRSCPLHEALVDAGYKDIEVLGTCFKIGETVYPLPVDFYSDEPPEGWTCNLAERLIKKANEGCEESYTFDFHEVEHSTLTVY